MQQIGRALPRVLRTRTHLHGRLGNDIQRRYARNHAQKLTDVTQRAAAHIQHFMRGGLGQIQPAIVMTHVHGTEGRSVVGIDHTQQGALARAGRTGQHHALARVQTQIEAAQHVQARTVLVVQFKGLAEVPQFKHQGGGHVVNTEETSNCVYGCCGSSSI